MGSSVLPIFCILYDTELAVEEGAVLVLDGDSYAPQDTSNDHGADKSPSLLGPTSEICIQCYTACAQVTFLSSFLLQNKWEMATVWCPSISEITWTEPCCPGSAQSWLMFINTRNSCVNVFVRVCVGLKGFPSALFSGQEISGWYRKLYTMAWCLPPKVNLCPC